MSLTGDLRAGYRSLRHAPGFAALAVGTLALGIGLATAVFTVSDAILIRRLPVVDQDRLVVLQGTSPKRGIDYVPVTVEGARMLASNTRALSGVASFLYNGATPITITQEGDRALRLQEALVSGNWFDVLGSRPLLGRALRPEDDAFGAAPVMVLSHRAWQQYFGGDASVLGRVLQINERSARYTIVGVMPPGLDYPRGADAWSPVLSAFSQATLRYVSLHMVGRLKPGATPAEARDELTAQFHRQGASEFEREVDGTVTSLPQLILGDMRPPVLAFAAAAVLLLLITCVNVANLLLVRGLGRVREVAVRTALGASRGRVVRQLVTEHALLAFAGGVIGVLVAYAAVGVFVGLAPAGTPRLDEVTVNATALLAASGITMVALLLFAVAPALLTSCVDVQEVLRSGLRQGANRASRLGRESLVAAQVALALLVLSSAGLVTRSLWRLQGADLAFDPTQVVVAELSQPAAGYETVAQKHAMLARVITAIATVPGVRDVSPVVSVPYASTRSWEGRPTAEGQTPEEVARNPFIDMEVVGSGFFSTLGLPIVRGRAFNETDVDGAPPAVILSASAAEHYWPGAACLLRECPRERHGAPAFAGATKGERRGAPAFAGAAGIIDPVGRRVQMGSGYATVVGIVPDARYRDLRKARPAIYFPLRQSPFPFAPSTLVIRSDRSAGDVIAALGSVLREQAPGVALASATPFESLLAGPLAQPRMNAILLLVFASAAVTLAGVGLFGVLATMVRQRRQELGIRMALGATAGAVSALVLRRAMLLAAGGVVAGVLGAIIGNRWLAALLYETSPTDAVTLVGVSALLLAVAALASLLPARAGARIEPATALRADG